MSRDEFDACMRQILVFYRRPRTEDEIVDFKLYMDGLYQQVGYLRADLFHRTCFDVAGDLREDEKKPMASRFKGVYAGLEERERTEGKVVGLAPAMTPEQNKALMLESARLLSPNGAKMALARAAEMRTTFPPDVVAALEERARAVPANPPVDQQGNTT